MSGRFGLPRCVPGLIWLMRLFLSMWGEIIMTYAEACPLLTEVTRRSRLPLDIEFDIIHVDILVSIFQTSKISTR